MISESDELMSRTSLTNLKQTCAPRSQHCALLSCVTHACKCSLICTHGNVTCLVAC